MSTDPTRHTLNGPTMGTRWAALFHAGPEINADRIGDAMQAAVDEVDQQMSTWKPDSDLMRLNAAPTDTWVDLPDRLIEVLVFGLDVGRLSGGAFDIGMGDAVTAWGFGATEADADRIRAALSAPRQPTHDVLDIDAASGRALKRGPLALDLSGIAKGYGVDRLAEVAQAMGIENALLSIDGELRALGVQPDGSPWTVAIERPDDNVRSAHSVLALETAAVATSGDYRHWVALGDQRLSHTMDPRRGGPLANAPASVTVVAPTCMAADAFATALMVLGPQGGEALARRLGLDTLFLMRRGDDLHPTAIGPLFGAS